MPFPPNLFLIGAQKSGTTKLANLLGEHPDICPSKTKEPSFFTHAYDKGLEWYAAQFDCHEARYLLDASVSYTEAMFDGSEDEYEVPRRIHEISPDARFLYLLREPGARLYSAYQHFHRTGREARSFEAVLDAPGEYFYTSNYAAQLQCYLRFFDRGAFLLLRNEDLASNPAELLERVYSFLELPPHDLPAEALSSRTNVGYALTPAGQLLWKVLGSRENFNALVGRVKGLIPTALRPVIAKAIAREPESLTPAQRERLDNLFAPTLDELERVAGFDVSDWR